MPTFEPPIAYTVPRVLPDTRGVEYALMKNFSALPCGRTVLKIGGTYATYDAPDALTVASATEVYLGGHISPITDAQAAALTAAGYGDGITY